MRSPGERIPSAERRVLSAGEVRPCPAGQPPVQPPDEFSLPSPFILQDREDQTPSIQHSLCDFDLDGVLAVDRLEAGIINFARQAIENEPALLEGDDARRV